MLFDGLPKAAESLVWIMECGDMSPALDDLGFQVRGERRCRRHQGRREFLIDINSQCLRLRGIKSVRRPMREEEGRTR